MATYAVNPTGQVNTSRWGTYFNNNVRASVSAEKSGGRSSNSFIRAAIPASSDSTYGGFYLTVQNAELDQSKMYTAKFWLRFSHSGSVYCSWGNGYPATSTTIPANTWTAATCAGSLTKKDNSGSVSALSIILYDVNPSDHWTAGDYMDVSDVMITEGTNTYSFADGNSSLWKWNGTTGLSTSSGPAPSS